MRLRYHVWSVMEVYTVNNLKVRFGKQVRYLRLRRQLTQEQLAEAAGISVDFLSLIERGRNAPSFASIQKLAEALGVPVKALFDTCEN